VTAFPPTTREQLFGIEKGCGFHEVVEVNFIALDVQVTFLGTEPNSLLV